MKLKNILAIIITIALIFGLAFYFASRPKIILFYSTSCVHCQKVNDFIAINNVKNKVKFRELEVSQDQANANLLLSKAKRCGLDTSGGLAVPFLFDGQKCLTGDVDIIGFFQSKL